jgi:hypothetical protein
MAAKVAVMPRPSLEDHFEWAREWVKSTFNTYEFSWEDDRACPYTGNAQVVLKNDLDYPAKKGPRIHYGDGNGHVRVAGLARVFRACGRFDGRSWYGYEGSPVQEL